MKNLRKIAVHLIILTIMCLPLFVGATPIAPDVGVGTPPGGSGTPTTLNISIKNPLKDNTNDIMTLVIQLLNNVVLPIGTVVCVMYIIWAGFKYVMAQGNDKKITEAHETLKWALVGTGVLLGSAGIAKVVENTVKRVITP